MFRTFLALTVLVALINAEATTLSYTEKSCTRNRDSDCNSLTTEFGTPFCCAEIQTSNNGVAGTTIYRCADRYLADSSTSITEGDVTTTYACTTSTPSDFV